jgi:F-type H+-transporting ATPase subunit b
MSRRWLMVAATAAALLVAPIAAAQQQAQPQQPQQQPPRKMPPPPRLTPGGLPPAGTMPPQGQMPPRGQMRPGAKPGPQAPSGPVAPHPLRATDGEQAEGDHGGHDAAPKPINWWHGFLGKKEGVEPSLLWRAPEENAPYLAALLNFAVFAWVIYHFGKKPVQESLSKRKEGILRDIEVAQKMREEAEKRLQQYEDKLERISEEIERIRDDFREQGERDKQRIQREAEEKRDRMLKDAAFLIEQESKEIRTALLRETVDAAVQAAEQVLRSRITDQDHDRLAETFLKQIASAKGATTSKGGAA